jgi:hypothetical protein
VITRRERGATPKLLRMDETIVLLDVVVPFGRHMQGGRPR